MSGTERRPAYYWRQRGEGGFIIKHGSDSDMHPMEILEKFIELTGKADPQIRIVTTAGTEGNETFEEYKRSFNKLGVTQLAHIHHNCREEVLGSSAVKLLDNADGIFFSGGDQLRLTSIYGGTNFLLALKKKFIYEGLLLAGTSAGAMAFSTPMIYAGNKDKQQIVGEVRLTTGLEFLRDICIDTHFVDRSRMVRLAQVIATNPTSIGIGIEENTAICVRNGTEVEVVGKGVVIIVEGYEIRQSNILDYDSGSSFSVEDLNVKLLSKGGSYQIEIRNPPHL